jgi:hypothetical protein
MIPLPIKFVFAALLLVLTLWLTGCSATFPLGQDGRFGSVGLSVSYQPPFLSVGGNTLGARAATTPQGAIESYSTGRQFPNVIAEQPNIVRDDRQLPGQNATETKKDRSG